MPAGGGAHCGHNVPAGAAGSKRTDRLQQAVLRERVADPVAHDEMVEHPHVDESEGLPEAPRDELIRLARLEDPGGVVVSDNP